MLETQNDTELNMQLSSNFKTIVDCYATWCGPCKAMLPVVEDLAASHPNINFIKVDIEKHPEFIKKLNIRSVPTLVYCEGESIQSLSAGFKTQSQIEKWIANNS